MTVHRKKKQCTIRDDNNKEAQTKSRIKGPPIQFHKVNTPTRKYRESLATLHSQVFQKSIYT